MTRPAYLAFAETAIPDQEATFMADFVSGVYRMGGDGYALTAMPGYSFARAAQAWAQTEAGVWTSFASGVARITDRGYLSEDARTNLCTNTNANPTTTTGVTKSGDAASTLTVVSDTAALLEAGLQNICSNGNVFKLDNSAGVAVANATIEGTTGTTGTHTTSVYWRGTGSAFLGLVNPGPQATTLTAAYARVSQTQVAASSGEKVVVRAAAGAVVYFILNQLELTSSTGFASSPIVVSGASATRPQDQLKFTHALLEVPRRFSIFTDCDFPLATNAVAQTAAYWELDSTNRVFLYRSTGSNATESVTVASSLILAPTVSKTGARRMKQAVTFDGAEYNAFVDGVLIGTQASIVYPTGVNIMAVGYRATGNLQNLFGYVKKIVAVPWACSDAEAIYRTT